jgi:hypothetical protein
LQAKEQWKEHKVREKDKEPRINGGQISGDKIFENPYKLGNFDTNNITFKYVQIFKKEIFKE